MNHYRTVKYFYFHQQLPVEQIFKLNLIKFIVSIKKIQLIAFN